MCGIHLNLLKIFLEQPGGEDETRQAAEMAACSSISHPCPVFARFKMNEGLENNLTQLYDNWTLYNSSVESVIPRSNITYVGFYLHQPSTAAIFIVSYLLIFLVCMVGNGVVCFIVLRSKNMRTVTNLFILNLAVSDLLVGIFCMPTTLLDNIITGERDSN
ncbi:hypothetical protein L3Q82_006815 [Scortum barcoo]|uniref:Uncharacterized protein n=1 Tax=Scortum barcoo TaxID=214431 RepID=A0ACB8WVT8_9TELE|nr:hypothetical protein L3Q82_006815 [Scortum barcoo]